MISNSRVKQSFFRFVVLLTVVSTAPGCGVAKEYNELVHGFWEKVDHLARADQINEQLKSRIILLEKENLEMRQNLAQNLESGRAQHLKKEALHEGGVEAARTEKSLVPEIFAKTAENAKTHDTHQQAHRAPASHGATVHEHTAAVAHGEADAHKTHDSSEDDESSDLSIMSIPPKKIFAESMNAFDRREFDRAARGFIALANHKENRIYATAQVNYMAGVSLFELHNYGKSLQYFQRSYDLCSGNRQPAASQASNHIVFAPRSLGWMALAHRKLGHKAEAQSKIDELINRFPHSAEAKRFR